MADITAGLVKELRDKTGAGMMDCKKALTETDGDLESAVDWLRKKGVAAAEKKAGRVAADGLVGVYVEGNRGALVEINSETDFVARNEVFQNFVSNVAQIALEQDGDLEKIGTATYPETERSVEEELTHQIATIGENMTLRRAAAISVGNGVVTSYVHNQAVPGLGKIGVLVALESEVDAEVLRRIGRQLAMHVAAANPQAIDRAGVDPEALARERAILTEQAQESGKPVEIVEMMVDGRLRKFYEEVVLLEQTFVIDGESKVEAAVDKTAKDAGAPIEVAAFVRFALGEGVER